MEERNKESMAPRLPELTDAALLALWAATMDELRTRELVRSANNPVADYAEGLVAKKLDLNLEPSSTPGYDAKGRDGTR